MHLFSDWGILGDLQIREKNSRKCQRLQIFDTLWWWLIGGFDR